MPDYTENWKYEQASDVYAYPSANASDRGDVNSEDNIAGITYHLTQKNFIIRYTSNEDDQPMLLGVDSASNVTIAKGSCIINGYYIEFDKGISAPLNDFVDLADVPNITLYVVIKLVKDVTGNIRGDFIELSNNGMKSICQGVAWSVLTDSQFNELKTTDTPYLEVGKIVNGVPENSPIRYAYIDIDKMYTGADTLKEYLGQALAVTEDVTQLKVDVTDLKNDRDSIFSKSTSNSKSLLNLIYPVGSIYMSVNNINPDNIFGGTWKAIHGRFLVAEGDNGESGVKNLNFSAGATGGEKDHLLTLSEIPLHNHSHNSNTHSHTYLKTSGSDSSINSLVLWGSQSGTLHYYEATHNPAEGFKYISTQGQGTGDIVPYTRQEPNGRGYRGYSSQTNPVTITNNPAGGGQTHNNLPPYLAVYMWQRIA